LIQINATRKHRIDLYIVMNSPLVGTTLEDAFKMRTLAAWYREFAELAGNPAIWERRLLLAEDLEREVARIELEHERKPRRVGR
jgi:hypothetical protein